MANTTFLDLPVAVTLDGTEVLPLIQPANSTSGVSKRATTQQIANLAGLLTSYTGIVTVPHGGTGTSTLAANGVLIGAGTGSVSVAENATSGYVLTANGLGLDPTFQPGSGSGLQPALSVQGVSGNTTAIPAAITGTTDQVLRVDANGTALTFGQVNLSAAAAVTGVLNASAFLTGIVSVPHGGTGTSSLTAFNVLLGNGTGTIAGAAPGGAGQLLIAQSAASNPAFKAMGGDLTLSEAGTATIANNVVTYSKIQTIGALSVMANASSSPTNAADVTGASNQTLLINNAGTSMAWGLVNITTATNITGILSVGNGGIGTTTLAASSVLLGNGTAGVTAVTNVTSGYILTSNGPGSAPSFQGAGGLSNQSGLTVLGVVGMASTTPAGIAGTTDQVLVVATSGTSLGFGKVNLSTSAAVTGTLPVSYGGIGVATLTANGVLLGNNTGAITAIANATSGYILTANGTSSAPTWQGAGGLSSQPGLSALGVTGNSTTTPAAITGTTDQVLVVQPNGTALTFGQVNLSTSAAVTGVLIVGNGGIGTSSLTAHGILVGAGTSTVKITAPGTSGQVLIGQGVGSDPVFTTISGDITVNNVGTTTVANNAVTYAKFQTVAGLSVVANASSATTNAAAITGTANQVLVVNNGGTSLGFGQVNLATTSAVTGVLPIANGGTNASVAATAIANLGGLALATTGQAFSGGVVLTSLSLGTTTNATLTLVAGNPPLQRMILNGTATIVAPSSDCEIDLLVTNAGSASTISFSGYSVGSNTGDTYATTSGQKFLLMSRTVNGSSTYKWAAFQ